LGKDTYEQEIVEIKKGKGERIDEFNLKIEARA